MDSKIFWLTIWLGILFVVVIISGMSVYNKSQYEDRVAEYTAKGLQGYRIQRCSTVQSYLEWHEKGWVPSSELLIARPYKGEPDVEQ